MRGKLQELSLPVVQSILKWRWPIGIFILLGLGIVIAMIPNLKVDNSIRSWYAEETPELVEYERFLSTFGNDDVVICGVEDQLPYYHPARIKAIVQLENALVDLPGVEEVSSFTRFPFQYTSDSYRSLSDLVEEGDSIPAPEEVRTWMQGLRSQDRLVGKDDAFIVLYVWPDTSRQIDAGKHELLTAIDSIAYAHVLSPEASVVKGGIGVVYDGINQATQSEGMWFIALSYLILIVSMLWISRSYAVTLLALLSITAATIAVLGFMLLFNRPINIITLGLPPLIMVIGVSNFVHFTLHARAAEEGHSGSKNDILHIIALIAVPVFFNMLTSAGGFLSLSTSSIQITRDYGLFAALGIISVTLLAIVAVVVFHRLLLKKTIRAMRQERIFVGVRRIMTWAFQHHWWVIGGGVGVFLFTLVGISRINIDTEPFSFIPRGQMIRSDHATLRAQIGDYTPLEFVLQFEKGTWKRRSDFGLLDSVQQKIAVDSSVEGTLSVLDFVLETYQQTSGDRLEIGESVSNVDQRKLGMISSNLWQDPFIRRLTTRRGDQLRIMAAIPLTSANGFQEIIDRIEQDIERDYGDRVVVYASGYLPLYAHIVDTVIQDQVLSLLIALGVVFCLIFLVLGSVRYTFLAVPSNLLPILIVLAVMGFAGINLDIASLTLAATILGIVVDDSLHMLFTYRRLLREGLSVKAATEEVAQLTGAAVLSTSLILILGYSIIAISSVPILSLTGVLMVTAVFAALLADLILLPAMVRLLISIPKEEA